MTVPVPTPAQIEVLRALASFEQRPPRLLYATDRYFAADVAGRLGISLQAASSRLRSCSRSGYVETMERYLYRKHRYRLTRAGREALARAEGRV